MPEVDIFKIFIERLEQICIPYFITGSLATIVYGEPRLTNDIDLVVNINRRNAQFIAAAFPLEEFYCPPIEVILSEAMRANRGHFNIIHHETGLKADIYIVGKDPFQKWAMENKKVINYFGLKLPLAPPEYVIIKKLEFYKEGGSQKHLDDIKGVLENSADIIDRDLLIRLSKEKNVFSILEKLLIAHDE